MLNKETIRRFLERLKRYWSLFFKRKDSQRASVFLCVPLLASRPLRLPDTGGFNPFGSQPYNLYVSNTPLSLPPKYGVMPILLSTFFTLWK
jgi:hypothetical protein